MAINAIPYKAMFPAPRQASFNKILMPIDLFSPLGSREGINFPKS